MVNESKLHPYSKKPASYKLVSREVPGLLPKEGSLVWKRAGFARHAVHVTKCKHSPIQHSMTPSLADITPPSSQIAMTSSGLQAVTSPKHPASRPVASPSGLAMAARQRPTPTSCSGTPLVSRTCPLPRTSRSCPRSPSPFCFGHVTSSRTTRSWTCRRATPARQRKSRTRTRMSLMRRTSRARTHLASQQGEIVVLSCRKL